MTTSHHHANDAELTPVRWVELHAAYEANIRMDRPPYAGVAIHNRHELQRMMTERGWSGEVRERMAIEDATRGPEQAWRHVEDDEASRWRRLGVARAVRETS